MLGFAGACALGPAYGFLQGAWPFGLVEAVWAAGACALGSAYGFLQGAWPFGAVEAVWAVVALRRFTRASPQPRRP